MNVSTSTTQEPTTTQEPGKNQPPAGQATATPEDLIKKAVEETEQRFKKEIAGLNRKNSDLEKQIQAKELEKLSEKEKAEKEIELARLEKEKILKETQEITRGRIKDRELHNAGIPVEFAKRINGDSEEEIVADVKAFKVFIDDLVKKNVETEINKKLGGKPPTGGESPQTPGLQAAYDVAKKAGKHADKIAILRAAAREGVEINQ